VNAEAVHGRAEGHGKDKAFRERFDCATARAVAGLNVLAELTLPFVRVGGSLVAYKGPSVEEEARLAQNALEKWALRK
jgi:16S rRNA (guanine527-N7)-methyltransferase